MAVGKDQPPDLAQYLPATGGAGGNSEAAPTAASSVTSAATTAAGAASGKKAAVVAAPAGADVPSKTASARNGKFGRHRYFLPDIDSADSSA